MITTAISDLVNTDNGVSVNELTAGMHVVAHRAVYQHHGIYVGDGKVAAYLLHTGVTIYSLEEFAEGDKVTVLVHDDAKFTPQEIVERALSREHEDNYSLIFNNCEHFANWCVTGEATSYQVREVAVATAALAAALLLSRKLNPALRIGGGLALGALATLAVTKALADDETSEKLTNTVCEGLEALGNVASEACDSVSTFFSNLSK